MPDKAELEHFQQTAHTAARRAGQVIRKMNDQPREVRYKGPRDLVTDTDTAAQRVAIEIISQRHPDHRIIGEEDPSNPLAHLLETGPLKGAVWFIDPVDGTTNYVNGLPLVSVSVGLVLDGDLAAGAVYDPLRDEMFLGARGLGATVNGRPLAPIKSTPLADALICLDWAREPQIRERVLGAVTALAARCRSVRALGSAALGLAYLAAGRVQAYFNFAFQAWDVVAGGVLIQEVGGDLRRADGAAWSLSDTTIVAGHPTLLNEMGPLG